MRSVPVSLGNTVFIHSCWGSGPNQVPNLRISTRQSGLLPVMNMKKAHDKSATWVCGTCRSRKVINYHNGGLRREVTVELVTQLNEMLTPGGSELHAVFSTKTRDPAPAERRSRCALHNFQRPPMDARAWGVAVIGASFSGSCCRIS